MNIISWNVNGIRAIIKKDFEKILKKVKHDVICLQEIKISEETRIKEEIDFPNYDLFWNSAVRPGYSGTLIMVKKKSRKAKAIKSIIGIGKKEFDDEGRVQTVELDNFYVVNIYFPNANRELSRLFYKEKFNNEVLKFIKKLDKKKPVIITGDYNVAHNEIDLARPKDNIGKHGFTKEERDWMTKFLKSGFVDTFRSLHPDQVEYSWWSYRAGARPKNIGWRIDYFCVSKRLMKSVKKAYILDKIMGSDHCPVGIEV